MVFDPKIKITTALIWKYFLGEAYRAGYLYSDDPVTKVGAVIVQEGVERSRILANGANHLKREVRNLNLTQEELNEKLKDRK